MRALALLPLVMLATPAGAEDEIQVGTIVRQELRLGAPSVRKIIPLPAGDWEIVRVNNYDGWRVHPNNYSNPPRMVDVALIQRAGPELAMMMRVMTLREPISVQRWVQANPCDRADTLYRNTYDSTVWETTCLLVNHVPGFLNTKAPAFAEVRQWVAKEQLKRPATALYGSFTRFGAYQNTTVQIWANPALRTLDSTEPNWAANPFHRDWIEKEPERRRYVDEFVAWSEAYMKTLLASPGGRPPEFPTFR
jgi:hypothetical protein